MTLTLTIAPDHRTGPHAATYRSSWLSLGHRDRWRLDLELIDYRPDRTERAAEGKPEPLPELPAELLSMSDRSEPQDEAEVEPAGIGAWLLLGAAIAAVVGVAYLLGV